MRMYDIIKKKRDGGKLSQEEINFFITEYTNGSIPDEQASAFAMAVFFQGMEADETAWLTLAMRDSGKITDLSAIEGFKVDKHSSGGVGDKTTLIVAPIVAACGVKVAKMSGRGLGHTGGTIDKLESIPGFRTALSSAEFFRTVNEVGVCVAGQSQELAPADKKLYALRDVTATVESLPLIASSIMSKKLASGADGIVLDVKIGSGSFNKTIDDGRALARAMVDIGTHAGKKVLAVLSDMDKPLGHAVGNALEVIEAIELLQGRGDADLRTLCAHLAASMLLTAQYGPYESCQQAVETVIESGKALNTLRNMVAAQGGDVRYVDDPSLFSLGKPVIVAATQTGHIAQMNTESIGLVSLLLGAGRNRKEDFIDHGAGLILHKKTGDSVQVGEPIATLYVGQGKNDKAVQNAIDLLISSVSYQLEKPPAFPIILDTVYPTA